jgi:phosphatidylserine/phosphatidylglycerophosphate/cardiolipin synthase-like enzyme
MSASSHRWGPGLRSTALAASLALALATPRAGSAQLAPPASGATQATSYSGAFTPGQALPLVLDTIRDARSTLLVAAYPFTSRPVATTLRDAQCRGVKVFVLVDAGEAAMAYCPARFPADQRVAVRIHGRHALQHNKSIVADGTAVQTGSFNYTSSAAQRNAENVLVVRNTPALASQYGADWRRLWDEGTELPPAY